MTKEQAVVYLRFSGFSDEQIKAIEGAFSCPSAGIDCEDCPAYEDAISRQAVIDMTGLSEWFDSSDSYNEFVIALSELPPATSQPKTGHWIPSHIPESILDECSECGFSCGAFTFNYCPNCGAKMVKPQESEKINCKTTKCENCQNHNYCDYEPQESEEKPKSEWEQDHEILKAYSDGASAVLESLIEQYEHYLELLDADMKDGSATIVTKTKYAVYTEVVKQLKKVLESEDKA